MRKIPEDFVSGAVGPDVATPADNAISDQLTTIASDAGTQHGGSSRSSPAG